MKLSEELSWRGFVNQTTYKDISVLDKKPISFYWGVDPSADSMTVGNLAIAMMVRHFINHGHKAYLLVGGATGMIGDPDGKAQERDLLTLEQLAKNKQAIAGQYERVFQGLDFEIVDNYDWFKHMNYLEFLRDVGKHAPMRQMLGREFVQSRLGEDGTGISYAEFSYSLIQGYDFLHLHRENGVDLQVCGADQWGNCIAGVDLIRRITGDEAHVWSAPLVVNKTTGVKFGKTEAGAVWLDPAKTSPTQFYQFWINVEDENVEDYLKIYTLLSKTEIEKVLEEHAKDTAARVAQTALAQSVTEVVHGKELAHTAAVVTKILTGETNVGDVSEGVIAEVRKELPSETFPKLPTVVEALVATGLASSNSEARRLIASGAVYINGEGMANPELEKTDFKNGRLLIRRGKAFKDSALIEIK
ncbi:MAG TPA: tyrosine--tRNA ligase [Candidatus Saccharimonadales bacterium]|nr:tyrosine--tRNA ligase [Candidatus Saccharimonadales bacterium]